MILLRPKFIGSLLAYKCGGPRRNLRRRRLGFGEARPHSFQGGFTLIEVVIAIGILAMMTLMIAQVMNGVISGKRRIEDRSSLQHMINVGLSKMYDDINMSFVADASFQGTENAVVTGFQGDGESMDFTTMNHLHYIKNQKDTDHVQVGYRLLPNDNGDRDLVRRESDFLTPRLGEGGKTFTMIPNVKSVNFEFYDSTEKGWQGQWDTDSVTSAGRLPAMVKITLVIYGIATDEDGRERREHNYEMIVPVEMFDKKISF